jgi:hypothetical protein
VPRKFASLSEGAMFRVVPAVARRHPTDRD